MVLRVSFGTLVAEESARYATSAEKLPPLTQDLTQVAYVTDAARLAPQRAQWAVAAVEALQLNESEDLQHERQTVRVSCHVLLHIQSARGSTLL